MRLTFLLAANLGALAMQAAAADPVKKSDTDPRFTEVVTVRRYVGQKDIEFLNPNPNIPGLRVETKLRDGSTQTRYYLAYNLHVLAKTEITSADGSVWVVTKYIDPTTINLKDGKGPLTAAVAVVEKKPAPPKK